MDNRTKILNSALELFATHGIDAVGVQKIAEAAGITKPTLYHYFGNKAGLIKTLFENHFSDFCERISKIKPNHNQTSEQVLFTVAMVMFNFSTGNSLFYRLQLSVWFAPPKSIALEIIKPYEEQLHVQITFIFKNILPTTVSDSSLSLHAATFLGIINTLIGISLNGYLELNEHLAKAAVKNFLYGLT